MSEKKTKAQPPKRINVDGKAFALRQTRGRPPTGSLYGAIDADGDVTAFESREDADKTSKHVRVYSPVAKAG